MLLRQLIADINMSLVFDRRLALVQLYDCCHRCIDVQWRTAAAVYWTFVSSH